MKVGIIGAGIAGLGCAYLLRGRHDVTVYEANDYAGGHTNTIDIRNPRGQVSFDTGFMVFNHVTYPNLTRLFRELGVATQPAPMSFSVQHRPSGLEYSGSSVSHLFAQRRNLLRPRFWRLLSRIHRFNAEAVAALDDPAAAPLTLGEFVAARGYGNEFRDLYLIPMGAAVWSTPPDRMLEFPAVTLIRFFHNHGFLGLHTQHPWFTVTGGARRYVERLLARVPARVRLNQRVLAVIRTTDGVEIRTADGRRDLQDRVILACPADRSLEMLADPDADERRLLGAFEYQPNVATVHQDESVMPRTRRAWASWNYRIDAGPDGRVVPSTVYWMNSLQGLPSDAQYFVSINGAEALRPECILRRIEYRHPLFNREAIAAQSGLPALNRRPGARVFFAGSYFKYGFHEDALTSAVECSRAVAGGEVWT